MAQAVAYQSSPANCEETEESDDVVGDGDGGLKKIEIRV